MSSVPSRKITADLRKESYEAFFEGEWSLQLAAIAQGTAFAQPVLDLVANWKAASNAHMMPSILVQMAEMFWKSFLTPDRYSTIGTRLKQKVLAAEGLSNMKRQQLNRIMDEEIKLLKDADRAAKFPEAQVWAQLFDPPVGHQFGLSIWGTERLCYASLYHSYENFVREVIGLKRGNPSYRLPRFPEFISHVTQCLGQQVVTDCITDPGINLARLVRHALAHNGGRLTSDLAGVQHDFPLDGDVLQIMPEHTKALFLLLKERATVLAAAAVR